MLCISQKTNFYVIYDEKHQTACGGCVCKREEKVSSKSWKEGDEITIYTITGLKL